MADISKVSIDGGQTELNIKDSTARASLTIINEKIPSAASFQNKLVDTASMNTGLSGKVDTSSVGVSVASLNGSGKVPESQLPSYVDDVIEGYLYEGAFYEDAQHTTQITPETGKIYIDLNTDKTYRWSGSVYVCTGSDIEIGETTGTAFDGGRGKAIEDKIPSNASSTNKLVTESDDISTARTVVKSTVGFETINILNCDIQPGYYTQDGIEYEVQTYQGNLEYIRLRGTATANVYIKIASEVKDSDSEVLSGGYILSGCPEGGSDSTFALALIGMYGQELYDYGEGANTSDAALRNAEAYICVYQGFSSQNYKVFYPMLRSENIKDSTYVPHHSTVKELLNDKQDKLTYSYSNGRVTLNTVAAES